VPELMILEALPVAVERDGWDWLLYALSLAAAVTAIVLFLPWALERRRRPEVGFHWKFSPDGDPANLTPWSAGYVPEIDPTQPFLVEAAIQNTGDQAGGDTLVNFVAPDCFDLSQPSKSEARHLTATHNTVGLPPEYRVVFTDNRPEPWTPGNWYMWQYRLQYSTAQPCDRPLRIRLLFNVSDSRFNSRGRRWLPSRVPPLEPHGAPVETPWPPTRSSRRIMRQARAEPRGRVACLPGERSDVRDLIVLPAQGGHTSVPGPAEEQPLNRSDPPPSPAGPSDK
jgi:hypothetical protein